MGLLRTSCICSSEIEDLNWNITMCVIGAIVFFAIDDEVGVGFGDWLLDRRALIAWFLRMI